MTTQYLQEGWYNPAEPFALRPEVVDGAVDAAGYLHRAEISHQRIRRLAMTCRTVTASLFRPSAAPVRLSAEQREQLAEYLLEAGEDAPELEGLVRDLMEHLDSSRDVMALYVHLLHIGQLIALYESARVAEG